MVDALDLLQGMQLQEVEFKLEQLHGGYLADNHIGLGQNIVHIDALLDGEVWKQLIFQHVVA